MRRCPVISQRLGWRWMYQLRERTQNLNSLARMWPDTGTTDPAALSEIFPDCIQGSLGVIRSADEAEQYSNATEHYFFKDEDVLYLDDGIYVVCKDWTVKNIRGFINIISQRRIRSRRLCRSCHRWDHRSKEKPFREIHPDRCGLCHPDSRIDICGHYDRQKNSK